MQYILDAVEMQEYQTMKQTFTFYKDFYDRYKEKCLKYFTDHKDDMPCKDHTPGGYEHYYCDQCPISSMGLTPEKFMRDAYSSKCPVGRVENYSK